jgi:dimethylargininase
VAERIAITRQFGAEIARCELTHLAREPIDVERAREQHREYEACLSDLGCEVRSLPAEPQLPDSVFVEDAAVVLDEVAVITRPGAISRRPEGESIAVALRSFRPLRRIEPPGTLDGGDVLRVGRALLVGLSGRTDESGLDQLAEIVSPLGYEVKGVEVRDCLHLKSAVTLVAEETLLVNPDWVDPDEFVPLRCIEVNPTEPAAANALLVGRTLVYSAEFPLTRQRLVEQGIEVRTVNADELAKAEGGVTCCSLIFDA